MPSISGHIGDVILFETQDAGATTGVFFGGGKASYEVLNQTYLNTRVPDTAAWGYVDFHKLNSISLYNVSGTGYQQTGASEDLNSNLISNGFLGTCDSGSVGYSNLFAALGVCNLSATDLTELGASGKMYNAWTSGYCGDDTNGYTNSGYSTSTTRLAGYFSLKDESGNWIAFAKVEDTGNFVYKKAEVDVTCSTPNLSSTDYKFVPIPTVSNFTPIEAVQGETLTISGKAFSGISDVSINDVNVNFQVVNNYTITGVVPAGTFNDKIELVGPSGIKAQSLENFVTFAGTFTPSETKELKLFSGQFIRQARNFTGLIPIHGENISGLTSGYLKNEKDIKTDLLGDPSFSHDSSSLRFSVSELQEGLYDVVVQNLGGSGYALDAVSILDGPSVGYSFKRILTSTLIEESELYDSREDVYVDLGSKRYDFSLSENANKICLSFDASNLTAGTVAYGLERYFYNNKTSIPRYFVEASGRSSGVSNQNALNKFAQGIYTRDQYNDPYGPYSPPLDCACKVISSQTNLVFPSISFPHSQLVTGVLDGNAFEHPVINDLKTLCRADFSGYAGENTNTSCGETEYNISSGVVSDTDYAAIKLSASSYNTATNINDINQQLNSYPSYSISGWSHSGISGHETHLYRSGVAHPILHDYLVDFSHSMWRNILHSGANELSNDGGGIINLTSGYSIISTGALTNTGQLAITGKNESTSRTALDDIIITGFSECETGNYSAAVTGVTKVFDRTSTFFGYSPTIESEMTGVLTALIRDTNLEISGEYESFVTNSILVETGVMVVPDGPYGFSICAITATGSTDVISAERAYEYASGLINYGVCENDFGFSGNIKIDNNHIFASGEITLPGAEGNYITYLTGYAQSKWHTTYNPTVSGDKTIVSADINCPTTNLQVQLERDVITWYTTGTATRPDEDIRSLNVELMVDCTGYKTTLTADCERLKQGNQNLCQTIYNYESLGTATGCWENYFKKGDYAVVYKSGSFENNSNKHIIGTGTLTVDKLS